MRFSLTPKSMRLPALALAALGFFAAGCTTLDVQQRKWIFQASPAQPAAGQRDDVVPAPAGMENVWIEHVSSSSGENIRLHGLWLENADPAAPLLLYLHGARR